MNDEEAREEAARLERIRKTVLEIEAMVPDATADPRLLEAAASRIAVLESTLEFVLDTIDDTHALCTRALGRREY